MERLAKPLQSIFSPRAHARVEALFFARILPSFCSHHARVKYPVFGITMAKYLFTLKLQKAAISLSLR